MSRELPTSVYTKRITTLRNFIAELAPKQFSMATWGHAQGYHDCDTAACIGGWAARIFNFEQGGIYNYVAEEQNVIKHLGLTKEQASDLFYPLAYMERDYTPEDAVAVLDNYLETGTIDWSVVD